MIKAMFHDSLAGRPFDFDAYGKSYRAYGDRNSQAGEADVGASTTQTTRSTTSRAAAVDTSNDDVDGDESPVVSKTTTTTSETKTTKPAASDILDRIRKKTMAG